VVLSTTENMSPWRPIVSASQHEEPLRLQGVVKIDRIASGVMAHVMRTFLQTTNPSGEGRVLGQVLPGGIQKSAPICGCGVVV
jgi:hypothetical protein